MKPGEVVDLYPSQVAAHINDLARRFVGHNAASLPEILEELRGWVVYSDRIGADGRIEQLAACMLNHVEQLHATIRQLAELSAVDGFKFALNQPEISRAVHKQLATFDPPKA